MSAQAIAKILLALRRWERQNAPIPTSPLANEIVYLVASRSPRNLVQVKDIYLALGYSEARTSEVLRDLVTDGWLHIKPGPTDRRTKLVLASRTSVAMLKTLGTGGLLAELRSALMQQDALRYQDLGPDEINQPQEPPRPE